MTRGRLPPGGGFWNPFAGKTGRFGAVLGLIFEVLLGTFPESLFRSKLNRFESFWRYLEACWDSLRAILVLLPTDLDRSALLELPWVPSGRSRGDLEGPEDRPGRSASVRPLGRGMVGGWSGFFSPGDPQGPPRARELEILLICYRIS